MVDGDAVGSLAVTSVVVEGVPVCELDATVAVASFVTDGVMEGPLRDSDVDCDTVSDGKDCVMSVVSEWDNDAGEKETTTEPVADKLVLGSKVGVMLAVADAVRSGLIDSDIDADVLLVLDGVSESDFDWRSPDGLAVMLNDGVRDASDAVTFVDGDAVIDEDIEAEALGLSERVSDGLLS